MAVVLALAGMQSCGPEKARNPNAKVVPGLPASFDTKESLKPDASPGDKATIVMGGLDIPVEVEHRSEGGKVSIILRASGEVIEDEHYANPADGFGLASAAGEEYSTPLPLLKFPLTIGDTWSWSGTMSAGGISRRAKATVSTTSEEIEVEKVKKPTMKVEVTLAMDGGGPRPAERTLQFWFSPGKGLVQREFGVGSSRKPGHPEPPADTEE